MDEAMGRRTVCGLLVTKAGSILVFREESPHPKATSCCTCLGCSSKLFPNKDRNMRRTANEAAALQRSPVFRKSNTMSPQGANAFGETTRRNAASTSGATDNRSRRREKAGRDLLSRFKESVNASRKRSSSGRSSPCPLSLNSTITSSSSSNQSITRSLHRPASRMTKDGDRNGESVRRHKDSIRVDAGRKNIGHDPSGRFPSRRLFRHSRLQGGTVSSFGDSLDDSNEYWCSEEEEYYYASNDQHRELRMDIDDMSYEELLALGERIGTVSTGLSDGVLSKCLERCHYVPTTSSSHEDAAIKCIICQEDYVSGVEVGKMVCKHYYHTSCIQQWLSQKNWCPICKYVASTVRSQCP